MTVHDWITSGGVLLGLAMNAGMLFSRIKQLREDARDLKLSDRRQWKAIDDVSTRVARIEGKLEAGS